MRDVLDGWAAMTADRLVSWLDGRVDASRRSWIAALAAEMDEIDSGWGKLRWAINGLPLAWSFRRPPGPRVAGVWSTPVNPRLILVALNRNKAAFVSYALTTCLVSIVAVLAIFVMPVFQSMAASVGMPLPPATRLVVLVLSSPYFVYGLLLMPLVLHWRSRRAGRPDIPARLALPVLNFICVVALIGMTSGFVSVFMNFRQVFRAMATSNGWSPPAPKVVPLLPSQQKIRARERGELPQ